MDSDRCYKCCFPTPRRQNGSVLYGNRAELWKVLRKFIFPLASPPAQDIWVMTQLIFSFLILGFSAGTIARERSKGPEGSITAFDIVQVSVAIVFTLAASIDAVIRISWRCCVTYRSDNLLDGDDDTNEENQAQTEIQLQDMTRQQDDPQVAGLQTECAVENRDGASTQGRTDTQRRKLRILKSMKVHDSKKIGRCVAACQDIIRMFVDIFLYPIFLCTILKHANNSGSLDFNYDRLEGSKFILLLCTYFVFYLTRLLVIIAALKSIYEALKGQHLYAFGRFAAVLILHYIGQCVVQGSIVAFITWIRVYSPGFSPYLWCIVVLGYLVPCVGNFAIFIPEYYFVEELIIQIYNANNGGNYLAVLYTAKGCCLKWLYAFISPLLVFLSTLYFILLCVFACFIFLVFLNLECEVDVFSCVYGTLLWLIAGIFFIPLINIEVILVAVMGLFIALSMISVFVLAFPIIIVAVVVYLILSGRCASCYKHFHRS